MDILFQEIKDQLDRIEGQTMKTNGRVLSLELWRYFIVGAIVLLGFITPYLVQGLTSRMDRIQTMLTNHITVNVGK